MSAKDAAKGSVFRWQGKVKGGGLKIVTSHFLAAVYFLFCEWHVGTVSTCVTFRWFCVMAARCV